MKNLTSQKSSPSEEIKYECELCKDTEFIFVDTNTVKPCTCVAAKKYKKLYDKSGITDVFRSKTFDNYSTDRKPEIIKAAKNIAVKFVTNYNGESIAMLGQVGAGKTHLCVAISGALMEKSIGVLYMQYRDAITKIKQNVMDDEVYQKELIQYKTAPVLYIDDLYKGNITGSDHNIMFEIINHRYLNNLPIIVSSEYGVKELIGFDQAIGSRILEMCKGFIIEFPKAIELNHRLAIKS
jgi:DNA replication protein DnaC